MKKTYKIKGMDCASCAILLEMDLEEAGIKAACSYAKETLSAEIKDESETKKIEKIVQASGFSLA